MLLLQSQKYILFEIGHRKLSVRLGDQCSMVQHRIEYEYLPLVIKEFKSSALFPIIFGGHFSSLLFPIPSWAVGQETLVHRKERLEIALT